TCGRGPSSTCGTKIHRAMEISAQAAPAMYSGRNPRARKAVMDGRCAAAAGSSIFSRRDMGVELRHGLIWLVADLVAVPQAAGDAAGEVLGLGGEGGIVEFVQRFTEQVQPADEHRAFQAWQGDVARHGRAA